MFAKRFRECCLVLMLLCGLAANADPAKDHDRVHVGVRVGNELTNRFDGEWDFFDTKAPRAAYAGWNFNSHWAIELGYTDLGQTRTRFNVVQDYFIADGNLRTLGLSYRRAVAERFDLFAGLGAFNLREAGRLSSVILDPPPIGYGPFAVDDTGAYLELGARYHFDGPLALRASYQWFDFDGGGDGTPWLGFEFGF